MIDPLKLLLFVALSGIGVAASVHAWRAKLVYGFFRFFGFVFLALLIVWNSHRWFHAPLSVPQILSWTILTAATALAVHGVFLLRSVGRAQKRVMEDTQTVVDVGVYRFIRHPLYASLMFLGWGVFFKGLDWPSGALALASSAFFIATARSEERFNLDRLGAAYFEYMKRTKMFIPFLL